MGPIGPKPSGLIGCLGEQLNLAVTMVFISWLPMKPPWSSAVQEMALLPEAGFYLLGGGERQEGRETL